MLVGLLTGLRCSLKQFLRRRFVSPIGSSGMGDFCKTKSFGRFLSRVAVLYKLGTLTIYSFRLKFRISYPNSVTLSLWISWIHEVLGCWVGNVTDNG